jgi:hypothetical protein
MSNLWITPEELGTTFAETEFSYESCKAASNLLWALSGRKYSGVTTVTERYVCATLSYRYGPSVRNHRAELVLGDIYNLPYTDMDSYTAVTTDGLSPQSRLRLRGRPVTKIHTIRNRAGVVVDPSSYYLVDHSTIQATRGSRWTPCDIEVTYTYGIEPPTLGKMAARTLALEFCKLWNGDDDCILPQRVTSVARQGVSYTLIDSQEFIDDLRTGLYAVDLFLKSVNPDRARAKARVFTPDVPRARRYTPKALKLGATDLDIEVLPNGVGTADVSLESINAMFLVEELGWNPYVIIRNYSDGVSRSLENAVTLSDPTPTTISVTSRSLTDNIVTLTTSAAHGLEPEADIVVAGIDDTFNGIYTVLNTPTDTTVTYEKVAADVVEAPSSGTITASSDDRITIEVEYSDALAVIGKVDPGTYDLYAERDSGSEIETIYIASGNLRIKLASSSVVGYTLG